jgi:quercetin dioxygenase-like cupin family protein
MLIRFTLPALALMTAGCAAKTAPVQAPKTDAVQAAAPAPAPAPAPASSVTMVADTKWMPVNPEKPEGPQMAVITGNPKEGAFSALVKFPAGAATPLHSHPANFTGVVVSGTVQNGRSAEDNTEMGPGTLWSEPAGEVHFTGCTEETDCIFVGHMDGPMGMTPAEAAAEGELNLKVTAATDIGFAPINPEKPGGPGMYVLAGDKAAGPFTALVKFPGGAQSPEHSHSSTYSAVVVSGTVSHGKAAALDAGSHWTEIGGEVHTTGCPSEDDCIFYASMDGAFDMKPAAAPAEAAPEPPAE